jgi:hypothetical protein
MPRRSTAKAKARGTHRTRPHKHRAGQCRSTALPLPLPLPLPFPSLPGHRLPSQRLFDLATSRGTQVTGQDRRREGTRGRRHRSSKRGTTVWADGPACSIARPPTPDACGTRTKMRLTKPSRRNGMQCHEQWRQRDGMSSGGNVVLRAGLVSCLLTSLDQSECSSPPTTRIDVGKSL